MNIAEALNFNTEKPTTYSVLKTEKLNVIAVGLVKNQILRKHKTLIPTFLTVLKGSISFHINNEVKTLNQFDTYQIPVNTEHEVGGIAEENIFTLTQEK